MTNDDERATPAPLTAGGTSALPQYEVDRQRAERSSAVLGPDERAAREAVFATAGYPGRLPAALDAYAAAVRGKADKRIADALALAEETLNRTDDFAALSAGEMERYTPAQALRMIHLSAERTVTALRALLVAPDAPRITRVEVVDTGGRAYTAIDRAVTFEVQDEGRTLKVFVAHQPTSEEAR